METPEDIEYDSEAPYGRKTNGQPYKTKPSQRNASNNYFNRNVDVRREKLRQRYQANKDSVYNKLRVWQIKNREKTNEYQKKYYWQKKAELDYYKELFIISLESV